MTVCSRKGLFRSSPSRNSAMPWTRIRVSSPPNSAITWRQAPHGMNCEMSLVAGASGHEMATVVRLLHPAATAAKMATRSAQMVRPSEAFSTLQPQNTLPFAKTAAPTRNLE